jgi:hypothetical protein
MCKEVNDFEIALLCGCAAAFVELTSLRWHTVWKHSILFKTLILELWKEKQHWSRISDEPFFVRLPFSQSDRTFFRGTHDQLTEKNQTRTFYSHSQRYNRTNWSQSIRFNK